MAKVEGMRGGEPRKRSSSAVKRLRMLVMIDRLKGAALGVNARRWASALPVRPERRFRHIPFQGSCPESTRLRAPATRGLSLQTQEQTSIEAIDKSAKCQEQSYEFLMLVRACPAASSVVLKYVCCDLKKAPNSCGVPPTTVWLVASNAARAGRDKRKSLARFA